MSFSSPKAPDVPDPYSVANSQQGLNTQMLSEVQAASNVNQATPTGTLTYTQTGVGPNGVPTYTATQSLTPAQQALLETMQGNQGVAGKQAGALLSGANYGATDPSKVIGDATSGNTAALLKQETDYLNPQFTTQTNQLDAKLRAQGIYPDSPAYQQQMRDLRLNQNQAVTGYLATAEPQAYQQAMSSYLLPGQTAASLMGISQPAGIGLTTTPQASGQPADLTGAVASANSANMAKYNADMAQQNAMMSGLFNLGSSAISGGQGGFGNSMMGQLGAALPAIASFI